MALPQASGVVDTQKTIRHTGNRVVVSESIEDTTLSREKDTGHFDIT
jgi:hypothetical protein